MTDGPSEDDQESARADEPDVSDAQESGDGIWHSVGRSVDRAARSTVTARAVSGLEKRVAAFRRERKIGKGTLRDTHVATYRGFISEGQAHIRIRVVEEPRVPDSAEIIRDPKVIRSNLRRFAALSLPGVRAVVSFQGADTEVVSNRHGYATAHLAAPADLAPGWYDYSVVTIPDDPDEEPRTAQGEVQLPDPHSPFIVISDVDDTVLRTGLTEGMVAVKQTLLLNAQTRRAIPGMAALYRAISSGVRNRPAPMFLYLSTGPWNLYEMLTDFLNLRGFPKGVLLLTDWGPQERYVMRSGKEHKRLTLARTFVSYPASQFVLIGDSGQNDPNVYVEVARQSPGRVKAIIIVDVGSHMADRAEELLAWQAELSVEGIPFHFVAGAVEAADVLVDLRIIGKDLVSQVRAAVAAAPPKE
jgi:phosphatidate phosphatase APP1